MLSDNNKKIIVILGPTSSGKTKFAVKLAARFNGEIISADSRQVYLGMDVGTGKDLQEYTIKRKTQNVPLRSIRRSLTKRKIIRIPYHLIDIVSPKRQFSVADFQKLAYQKIEDILSRGKAPILCGGTGLYISAVTEGYRFANGKSRMANRKIRKKLNKLSLKQLLVRLKKIDPKTYKIIDKKNRRRVQRALEIYYQTGLPKSKHPKLQKPPYQFLILGLNFPKEILKRRIEKRLIQRLEREGMIAEVRRLHQQGVSWRRLEEFGLEYRWLAWYLQKKIDYNEMVSSLKKAIFDFAKRQLTWFKRNKKIKWLKNYFEAEKLSRKFLNS